MLYAVFSTPGASRTTGKTERPDLPHFCDAGPFGCLLRGDFVRCRLLCGSVVAGASAHYCARVDYPNADISPNPIPEAIGGDI